MSQQPNDSKQRRDFLASASWWTTVGAFSFATVGVLRMPKPGVMPGPASLVKIGAPGDYPVSDDPIRVPGQKLYVLHNAEGFAVLGAICTHLGCIVTPNPEGFECPCHGSRFDQYGKVKQGPAPSPLAWFEVTLSLEGQMVVDTRKTIPVGTFIPFSDSSPTESSSGLEEE